MTGSRNENRKRRVSSTRVLGPAQSCSSVQSPTVNFLTAKYSSMLKKTDLFVELTIRPSRLRTDNEDDDAEDDDDDDDLMYKVGCFALRHESSFPLEWNFND